jgi:hypothetical protein
MLEWRFAYFCANNAGLLVTAVAQMHWELAQKGKPSRKEVQDYTDGLRLRLLELLPNGPPTLNQSPNNS